MFVVRCRCVDYVGGKEVRGVGYLDKDCRVSIDPSRAHKFASEAEAWDFASSSGELGYDESGLFCWVEPEGPMLLKSVTNCARCCGDHENLEAKAFIRPITDDAGKSLFTHWAMCPTTQEPILVARFSLPVL